MIKSGLLAEIPCWSVRPWVLASHEDDDDDDEEEEEEHDDNDEEEVADCDDGDDDKIPCTGVGSFLCMVPPTSQPSQNILRIKFAEFFGI